MTAVLDFVGDPVSRYNGGSGGMEHSVLSVLHRLCPRICLVRYIVCVPSEVCVTSGRSQERGGEM